MPKFWNVLAVILSALFGAISPEVKKLLVSLIRSLYAAAKKTDNPIDDILVEVLADLLTIKLTD